MFVLSKPPSIPATKKQSPETEVSCHHIPNDGVKFYFCFNGGTLEDMFNGILIDLDTSMNPKQCQEYLLNILKERIDMENKQLIVYLSGGVPFIGGTINDLYSNEDFKFDKVIYGIITKNVSPEVIDEQCTELCNISDSNHQLLISPLCSSTSRGMSDMACLLGYLNHLFSKAEQILLACSKVITFAPFITSIKKVIDGNQVIGRDIITVTSTFYTFFRSLTPKTTKDEFVLEYSFHLCNLICKIKKVPKSLPILVTDTSNKKFLSDLNLGPLAYIWLGDSEHDFNRYILRLKGSEVIQNTYDNSDILKPIAPLSALYKSECAIIKGKDHNFLYLAASSLEGDFKKICCFDIVDPMSGQIESVDAGLFAKKQGESKDIDEIVDPVDIKQIIMINLDSSNLMNQEKQPDNDNMLNSLLHYLSFFTNKIYHFHIPTIHGLVSFNEEVTLQCQLTPFVLDFDDGLKKVHSSNGSKLWDSICRSCEELVNFKKRKECFKNSVSRILVISCGCDDGSHCKVEDLVKELMNNKIIVDSVIFGDENTSKLLCAVCHITGGISLRFNDVYSCFLLFEQSAFFKIDERKRYLNPIIPGDRSTIQRELKEEMITSEFIQKAEKSATYDTTILNNEILFAQNSDRPLDTPAHICSFNKKHLVSNSRMKRLSYEVYLAALMCDERQVSYDPNIKIFIFRTMIDRWKVFMKGPEGSPYENKWWYIYVNFTRHYPYEPPFFRFISIPYHLNVAFEGNVIFNISKNGYNPSKNVVDIIKEIREVLIHPDIESPSNLDILNIFKHNHDEYESLARKSTEDNAKDDYHDFIKSTIDDSVPDGFSPTFDKNDLIW